MYGKGGARDCWNSLPGLVTDIRMVINVKDDESSNIANNKLICRPVYVITSVNQNWSSDHKQGIRKQILRIVLNLY